MNAGTHSKTSLFLMEIIIAIFFFSLSSAICLRLFVSAHTLSQHDSDLNNALLWSQSLSESFYGCNGNLLMIKNLYPDSFLSDGETEGDGTIIIFFDKDWNVVDNSLGDASYEAMINIKKDSAKAVYSDIKEYDVAYEGEAIVGNIAVINIQNRSEEYLSIPENTDDIIFSNNVDIYIGN